MIHGVPGDFLPGGKLTYQATRLLNHPNFDLIKRRHRRR